jgi:hypothetical protein
MIIYGPIDPCAKRVGMRTLLLATSNLHVEEFPSYILMMSLRLLSLRTFSDKHVEEEETPLAEN